MEPSCEQITYVAQALFKINCELCNCPDAKWETQTKEIQKVWRKYAVAAIKAMEKNYAEFKR